MRGFLVIALVFLLSLSVQGAFALTYTEGIHLVRPDSEYIFTDYATAEYLSVEDIFFVSCIEEDVALRNSLLCLDDNSFVDLDATSWSDDNCYLSSHNLEDFSCKRLILQAEYTLDGENFKLTKPVRVNKLSSVLDSIVQSQYSDGGWSTPLYTAYGVWALSHFKEIYSYELELGLDWLKLNRQEEEKCWPKSPCNVKTSAQVLSLLSLSNYTDAKRVVNDARNWLEELHNTYNTNDDWKVSISPVTSNTTLTLVGYEQTVLDENFSLPTTGDKNYTFDASEGKEIIVLSDDNVILDVINQDGDVLISYQGDNFSYTIPGSCWSANKKGESCDNAVTMFALTSDLDDDIKDNAKDWAKTKLLPGSVLGLYFGNTTSALDTALYVYNLYDDEDADDKQELLDWMLYTQNNEGSWDNGSIDAKTITSAYAVLSLFEADLNRSSEPIEDAEEWVSENEEDLDVNNTASLASAFYILRHNARPLLVSTPKIITIDNPLTTVELFNPTTFNLKDVAYEFSDSLSDLLTVDAREEIESYSFRKLKISRAASATSEVDGFLTISNFDAEIAKIPVILTNTPSLNVTMPDSVTVFGTRGDVKASAKKSGHSFVCSVSWDSSEIQTPGSLKIQSDSFVVPVQFSQALTKEDVYSGTMDCSAAGKTSSHEISVYVRRFASLPLTVTPSDAVLNNTDSPVTFFIQNNLDQDLSVGISIDRHSDYFSFRNIILLDPNERANLTLQNNIPADINLTANLLVQFSTLDRTEVASLLVDVTAKGPESLNLTALLVRLTILLAILGGIGFAIWKFRDVIILELNKLTFWKVKAEKKKELKKIKTIKSSERKQAIVNLYNILKFQNKDEKEIAQKLLANFNKEDVKTSLNDIGVKLSVLDEEAPDTV